MNTPNNTVAVEITTFSTIEGALVTRRETWTLGATWRFCPEVLVPGGGSASILESGNVRGISGGARHALGFRGITGEGVRIAA